MALFYLREISCQNPWVFGITIMGSQTTYYFCSMYTARSMQIFCESEIDGTTYNTYQNVKGTKEHLESKSVSYNAMCLTIHIQNEQITWK